MPKLLYINSSPRGEHSESRALAITFLEAYKAVRPDLDVRIVLPIGAQERLGQGA